MHTDKWTQARVIPSKIRTQSVLCGQLAQLYSGALQWLSSRPAADTTNLENSEVWEVIAGQLHLGE